MTKANINDRASLERLYPTDAFREDAGRNSLGAAAVLHGLRILSAAGPDGTFEIARAKKQAGERDPEGDTVFVPATLKHQASLSEGADAQPPEPADPSGDYADFVARVLEIARTTKFKAPIGQDGRLKGFHGG